MLEFLLMLLIAVVVICLLPLALGILAVLLATFGLAGVATITWLKEKLTNK